MVSEILGEMTLREKQSIANMERQYTTIKLESKEIGKEKNTTPLERRIGC